MTKEIIDQWLEDLEYENDEFTYRYADMNEWSAKQSQYHQEDRESYVSIPSSNQERVNDPSDSWKEVLPIFVLLFLGIVFILLMMIVK